jgi:hypothetical protein
MPVASTAPPDREDDTAMPASAAQPNSAMPTRDDLVIAWADHVLASLKPRARAVYNVGRFVAMEDGVAVFALPNSAHVEHAAPLVKDVAEAISRQVGVRIGLRLITEAGDFDGGRDDPSAASDSARDAARAAPTSGDTRGSPSQPAGLSPSQPAGLSPSQPAGLSAAQTAARAVQPAGGTIQPVEPETEDNVADFDDLASGEAAGRHDSLLWAEGRLLEAFPGTEEVP